MLSLARSGPFKIAMAFAGVVTVASYLVLCFVYLRFYSSNVLSVSSVLQGEVVKARTAPTAQLRRQLELRLTQDLRHLDYVALYDGAGVEAFGNVPPGLVVPRDGQAHVIAAPLPRPDSGGPAQAVFVAVDLPGGGAIVLGRSLLLAEQLLSAMAWGAMLALAPVVAIALLAGAFVSLRASRRLLEIRGAIDRVMLGQLEVRLPVRGGTDDIDELVGAVNHMLDEIVRLLQQIKSVGDNIAHDLRAPLTVMRARLERGLAGNSEPRLRTLAAEALLDLDRAMTTVTALLRISELESGLRRSAFTTVDLSLVCRDVFDLYEPLAEARDIAMSLDAVKPVQVTGDADLIREALANLVDNAIKFTQPGGHVAISSGVSSALMRVSDNGPGIASDERTKILKRFYRSTATRHVPGGGLGLSMASTIIDLHGFDLRIIDNAPGASFEIVLPPTEAIVDKAATRP